MTILLVNFLLPASRDSQKQGIVLATPENIVSTKTNLQQPTKGWLSQGYHWYHQAIDIGTRLQEKVYPIKKGRVISVEYKTWGYGHFIVIDHGQGYQSLYAHLDEIKVKPNQNVEKSTLLGNIGLTGWTTGPHLHLEIYKNGAAISPLSVLPDMSTETAYSRS